MTGVALIGGKNLVTGDEYGIIYPTSSDALTLDSFVGRCIHTEGLLPPFVFSSFLYELKNDDDQMTMTDRMHNSMELKRKRGSKILAIKARIFEREALKQIIL